jgi:restriction system protein
MNAWLIRAGRGAVYLEDFISKNFVALGWCELGDLSHCSSKAEIMEIAEREMAGYRLGQIRSAVSQTARFLYEVQPGDRVATYDTASRTFHLGTIEGKATFIQDPDYDFAYQRSVKWETATVSRDKLSVSAKNTLGAIQTLFLLPQEVLAEMESGGVAPQGITEAVMAPKDEAEDDLQNLLEDIESRAHEFIKDRIEKLGWEEMQELAAGILRALGYRTQVSPPGPDRGRDVIASPDGLGIESPRIRVEVKHRPGTRMGAPDIRSFIGGMREGDRGIYLSTGGFANEAKYEADRAERPVTLIDMDELVALVVEHYESMDVEARGLVPLKKFYWPESN